VYKDLIKGLIDDSVLAKDIVVKVKEVIPGLKMQVTEAKAHQQSHTPPEEWQRKELA